MEPRAVDAARVREVGLFLDSGRSIVVAGSRQALAVGPPAADGTRPLALQPTQQELAPLLTGYGLSEIAGLPCDRYSAPPPGAADVDPLSCVLRCIAPNQDFRTLVGQPNGDLVFSVPTSWRVDGELLQARGLAAEVLASSSDETWVVPRRDGALARTGTSHNCMNSPAVSAPV
jgi:hypothetical protein